MEVSLSSSSSLPLSSAPLLLTSSLSLLYYMLKEKYRKTEIDLLIDVMYLAGNCSWNLL